MATAKTAKPKASFIPESKEAVMKKDLLDALDPKRKKGFQNTTKKCRDDWVSPDGVWAYHMGYHQYTMDPELTTTNQNMKCILQMQDDPLDKQYDYSRIAVGNESMCVYEPRELLKETDNIQNLMDASTLASIEEILEETQDLDWLGIGNLVAESNMNPDGRFGGYADVSGEWMILKSSPELILAMSPGCLNVKRKKYLVYNFMIFCSGTRNVWLGQYFLAAKEMHPIIEERIINRLFSIRKIPEGFNEDTPFLIEAELPLSGNIFEHYKEVLCDPSGDKVDPSAHLTPLRALYEKSKNASPDDIDKLYEKLPPYQLYEDAEKIVAALDRCGCADAAAASRGEIKNIRALHILRSLTFSSAALARLQKKDMDSFAYDDITAILHDSANRKWLNYSNNSYCRAITFLADRDTFFISANYSASLSDDSFWKLYKMRKKANVDQSSRASITFGSAFGGHSSFGGEMPFDMSVRPFVHYKLLESLHTDLVYIKPVIDILAQELTSHPEAQDSLHQAMAEAVIAWCAFAIAAKEPFYLS